MNFIISLIILFGDKFLHNKIGDEVDTSLPSKYKLPLSGDIVSRLGYYSIFIKIFNSQYVIFKNTDDDIYMDEVGNNDMFYVYNLEQKLMSDGSKLDLKNLLDTYILK